ncbi:hypothetical protein BDZ91DRAFT_655304 [Kalaharituber pfeilii]|nr:hypothetical protein BDZ91DRAFT_655304 [Kalaharituber pfeilii]
MSAFFSKVFKGKDSAGSSKKSQHLVVADTKRPQDEDPWLRTEVSPDEICELLRLCTKELKLRGLSTPFVLLPFRPVPDPGSPRNFIRNFFNNGNGCLTGPALEQELRLTEPMVLCSIMKWCWGRLPGGVVTWEVYELFRTGEADSNMARDAFSTFIPISVTSQSRAQIIFDFFDLFSAIAAHAKTNGLAGLKLSRLAGWWAFEHHDSGWGFEGGYSSWTRAADATMHLFFAYLRSLSPEDPSKGSSVPMLPTSLRALLHSIEYPPPKQAVLHSRSVKVVMTVETVSPTPFALLRRAKNFQFRDDDKALQAFVSVDDPIQSLTEECRRVLKCISQTNESSVSSLGLAAGLRTQPSWSKFQDLGFSGVLDEEDESEVKEEIPRASTGESFGESFRKRAEMGPSHRTGDILARPTTPSWADFMVAGFAEKNQAAGGSSPLLLPPDKQLPPIDTASSRVRSSQSNINGGDDSLDPGELASVTPMDIDDAFWWVWMSSLAGEESSARKAVFGRCALAETKVDEGKWLVLEEKVKGAAQVTDDAAYIANKKGTKRGRLVKLGRRRSVGRTDAPKVIPGVGPVPPPPKPNIDPDVAARVQSVAAQIRQQAQQKNNPNWNGNSEVIRKNSAFQLQPVIVSEATSAMKWANKYDRDAIRDAYLKGTPPPQKSNATEERSLPDLPKEELQTKPLPAPIQQASTFPIQASSSRAQLADAPVASPLPIVQRPSSPVNKNTPPASATSPKSVQSATSISSPEKLQKTKSSRLGKLFGRKGEKQGGSRSTTPLPENPIKSVSSRDISVPVQRTASVTNGKENLFAPKSPTSPVNDVQIPPIPPKDPSRKNSKQSFGTGSSSKEERTAQQTFSNFDAGPLTDMPAFVPEDSPEPSIHNQPTSTSKVHENDAVSPVTQPGPSVPEAEPPVSPGMDRWAQIRKNAAERAAKKNAALEENTSVTATRGPGADDGDTSGEETIESRVARIKARVAELTGNIDPVRPKDPL